MAKNEKTLEQLQVEYLQAQKAYEAAKKLEEQKQKEEAERKRAELDAVKAKRKEEIEAAKKHYMALIAAYIKDYGSYQVVNSYDEDDDFPILLGRNPWKLFF